MLIQLILKIGVDLNFGIFYKEYNYNNLLLFKFVDIFLCVTFRFLFIVILRHQCFIVDSRAVRGMETAALAQGRRHLVLNATDVFVRSDPRDIFCSVREDSCFRL